MLSASNAGLGGVVAVLVDGQLHGQLAHGSQVPGLAVVLLADLVRRVRQPASSNRALL